MVKQNNELWKDIKDYEGLYQISNLGRVKSLRFGKEKILKYGKSGKGYFFVNLCKNGEYKSYIVHRLIAKAFIPNPENLPEVNHKDENKQNNCVENLEWCTHKYNNNYRTRNNRMAKANSKPILQFTKNGEYINQWSSAIEIERKLGFYQTNISKCCLGKIKTAYNYTWRFAEQEN